MGLNAALIVEPDESWGRTYVEHLQGLARDARVPEAVREASRAVLDAHPPGGDVISLRTPRGHKHVVEAARDVVAHAWAVAKRHEALPASPAPGEDAGAGNVADGGEAGDRGDAKDD
jgi:hypothetical protein